MVSMKLKEKVHVISEVVDLVATYFGIDPVVEICVARFSDGDENEAYAYEVDKGFYELEFNRDFIKAGKLEDIIKTAAHEMVHVKQYMVDGLDMPADSPTLFRGEKYKGEYWFAPWEVEARGYEEAFLQHYLYWATESHEKIKKVAKRITITKKVLDTTAFTAYNNVSKVD